jgi:hypothetical protein
MGMTMRDPQSACRMRGVQGHELCLFLRPPSLRNPPPVPPHSAPPTRTPHALTPIQVPQHLPHPRAVRQPHGPHPHHCRPRPARRHGVWHEGPLLLVSRRTNHSDE